MNDFYIVCVDYKDSPRNNLEVIDYNLSLKEAISCKNDLELIVDEDDRILIKKQSNFKTVL